MGCLVLESVLCGASADAVLTHKRFTNFKEIMKTEDWQWLVDVLGRLLSDPTQFAGGAVLGFLLGAYINHLLAKSRDRASFGRTVDHQTKQEEQLALRHLGIFSEGLRRCYENGQWLSEACKHGPPDLPFGEVPGIDFDNYDAIKDELIKLDVFSPKEWNEMDKLRSGVTDIREVLLERSRQEATVRCFHFSELCGSLWGISAKRYVELGGRPEELTNPLPLPGISK